jgi:outer membrane protein assembly factor BamB
MLRPAPSIFAATLLVLALALISVPSCLAAKGAKSPATIDWPHFRFDKLQTGYQPFETALTKQTIKTASLLWQADLPGELVFLSSPAVVNGIVYIGDVDGTLYAYAAEGCGDQLCTVPLWQSSYLAEIVDSPTVANGIVYVGSQTSFDDGHGKLNAFDAKGCGNSICNPLWQGKAGKYTSYSSPVVWNGFVFMGSSDGFLYAFNAEGCGKKLCDPLWAGKTGAGVNSTAVVYKGMVLVGSDDGTLNAFKAKGCGKAVCRPKWTGDIHGPAFQSSPAIVNGVAYIGSNHALSAFNADGCGTKVCAPLWQAIDDNLFFYGSPAVANGRVYIPLESQVNVYDAGGCGKKVCNAIATLFGTGMQDAIESSPTVANGVVYAGRNSSELLAWDADCNGTCSELWIGHTDDPIVNSSPTVVNGKVYIGGSQHGFAGRLYVYGLP